MKKYISAILSALILSSALLSCSNPEPQNVPGTPSASPESDSSTETETETEPVDPRMAVSDDLPESDFGGRTFTVIGDGTANERYIAVEDQNGEGVNDSVFARNLAIDERYNAKVAYLSGGAHRDCAKLVENCITTGDVESFDLIQFHVVSNSGNAVKGLYLNWYDVPHVNFDKPWWSDSTVDDLTINGRCYLAMGDFALTTISKTYCMFYDKDSLKNYAELDNFYDVVKEGRWTLDYLRTVCDTVYNDTNGNGRPDDGDYFGLASDQQSNYNTYLWACDNPVFRKNSQGELELSYYSEHLVDIYNKCYTLINNTTGVITQYEHHSGSKIFANNAALTCNALLEDAITYLADYDHEYGIIPYPKYDEAQTKYRSMVDGGHEAMAVGKQAKDLEFIGIMTEVLCAESYKRVLPAYYDVCLKQRYASSPEDAEMIDVCVESRIFDFGYVYDNWKGASFFFEQLLRSAKQQDITSYYKGKSKAVEKYYNSVIEMFYADEN